MSQLCTEVAVAGAAVVVSQVLIITSFGYVMHRSLLMIFGYPKSARSY